MDKWSVETFTNFFETLWGYPPFSWQKELALRVLENSDHPWPDAIALATASGKTACIDIAIFALAASAMEKNTVWVSSAPRRVFFVVDRRVIVDEAYERARKIGTKLRTATERDGILFEVAERLRKLAGGNIPLMCFQLRGGMYRSDAWTRSPLQPAVIASTVDQVGSRLLFRSYGGSPKAWPIQAGLVGNDSLILLDEAHCSQPFMETLQSVRQYRTWADTALDIPFYVSIMSATPPKAGDIFRDNSEETRTKGHRLGDRQLATKKTLLALGKASGKTAKETLAKELAAKAEELAQDTGRAVVIFANYVATAREVYRLLREKHKEHVILLTGRMRPIDKDDVVAEQLKKFQLSSSQAETRYLDRPLFVVATQTLEVGADLDFDILVTECASLDALRQRFGRLNRMGRDIEAKAAILMRADMEKSSVDDPVYGEALGRTWNWLNEKADDEGLVDMGIVALSAHFPDGNTLMSLNAPTVSAPVMLPAHVDCWCQTMPEPTPTPDVSVFLHGPGRASADVQVCWRADINLNPEKQEQSLDVLALCSPSAAETLSVPIWTMRRWMEEETNSMDQVADVEGAVPVLAAGTGKGTQTYHRRMVRWLGREESEVIEESGKIQPGDVLVIPADEKGWEGLGDFPMSDKGTPILDWGDRAYSKARGKALLRLHPNVVDMWPECSLKSSFLKLAQAARSQFDEEPEDLLRSIKACLVEMVDDKTTPKWLRDIATGLNKEKNLKRCIKRHPLGLGILLQGMEIFDPQAQEFDGERATWFSDEGDATSSGTTFIPLRAHVEGVANLGRRFALGCGLSEEIASTIYQGGQLHDTGKADPRFQALLRGGNPWTRGELLAKSEDIPQASSAYLRARKSAGYPEGGRHELLSVRLAESDPGVLPEDPELLDLTLHLIASHHGHCRPFAPVVFDDLPIKEVVVEVMNIRLSACTETKLERLDSGVAERFWRLTRRYGWWGLAWLEAIFRLADHRQSEREEKEWRAKQ